jgi:hypothetical protein
MTFSNAAALESTNGSQPAACAASSASPEPPPASAPIPVPAAAAAAASNDRKAEPAAWRAELASIVRSTYEWVRRPRVRLTLAGTLLLVIGALIISNSVWTLPLVIGGALMVAIAWIGHRLDGRLVVEWGEAGTELAFRATVKAAHPVPEGGPRISSEPQRLSLEHRSAPEPTQVIDGEAHTVEVDVAELKALIAAAEAHDVGVDAVETSPQDIHIRRVASDAARAEPSR